MRIRKRGELSFDTEIWLRDPHPGQQQVIESLARFRVVACGRRWGKTEIGKMIALDAASTGGIVWWVMPSYSMAEDVWRDLKSTLNGDWREKLEDQRTIVMRGGGMLRVRSGHDPDSLRGPGLDLAVIDEAAFVSER